MNGDKKARDDAHLERRERFLETTGMIAPNRKTRRARKRAQKKGGAGFTKPKRGKG